ncbi:MAG: tetratricopeptide repeat protein [Acidobacteriota bacterium]
MQTAELSSVAGTLGPVSPESRDLSWWIDQGNRSAEAGQFVQAVEQYGQALRLNPHFGPAWHNLGNLLLQLKSIDSAVTCYRNAVQYLPSDPLCAYSLGRALNLIGQHREALGHLTRARRADPRGADIWTNLGIAHQHLGHAEQALACYDRAAALSPDAAESQMNRAVVLLDQENFAEGWRAYEYRWQLLNFAKAAGRFADKPRWQGEPLAGKRILLHAEQGYGDMIQFARFVPQVAAMASEVYLEVPSRLWALFADLLPSGRVLSRGGTLPHYDLHCPLMSLPLALGLAPDTIPSEPYLRVPAEQRERARHALAVASRGSRPRLRAGLAWRGNPSHRWDRVRSLRPAQLAPLAQVPGVQWVLLQQDATAEELSALAPGFAPVHLRQQLDGFLATAALIEELDLVVSVDTVTGHLTGALGQPLWLLLPAFYDWRWHSHRADSPWYPSAQLFRQEEAGEWTGVVERAAAELAQRVQDAGRP